MILNDRRSELGYTVDQLSRLSGVPRYRIHCLENGNQSLRLIPFYQGAALACALEVPLYLWYHAVMSESYAQWLKGRLKDNG